MVKYCYKVTNMGETHLAAVTVTDDKLGFVCYVPCWRQRPRPCARPWPRSTRT